MLHLMVLFKYFCLTFLSSYIAESTPRVVYNDTAQAYK